jgi:hypothetical protein
MATRYAGAKRKAQPRAELQRQQRDERIQKRLARQVQQEQNPKRKPKKKTKDDPLTAQRKHFAPFYEVVSEAGTISVHYEQQSYASNPERLRPCDSKTLKCEYNDIDTDSLVWTTTLQLATIMQERTVTAYCNALIAVRSKQIDLRYVDCFLPVFRDTREDYCYQCKATSVSRKLSILRMWLGDNFTNCLSYKNDELNRQYEPCKAFFFEVLIPTGLATRYNEPCDCSGQTAIDWLIDVCYGYYPRNGALSRTNHMDQATLMTAYFSPQLRLNIHRQLDNNAITYLWTHPYGDSHTFGNTYRPNLGFMIYDLPKIKAKQQELDAIAIPILHHVRSLLHSPCQDENTTKSQYNFVFGRVCIPAPWILVGLFAEL